MDSNKLFVKMAALTRRSSLVKIGAIKAIPEAFVPEDYKYCLFEQRYMMKGRSGLQA